MLQKETKVCPILQASVCVISSITCLCCVKTRQKKMGGLPDHMPKEEANTRTNPLLGILKLAILGAAAVKAATPKSVHLGERDDCGKPDQVASAGPVHVDSECQVDGQFDHADSRTKKVAHHATQH
jgi:hypothetical protein